ncbi:hypothetical protein A2U01_0018252 [Trifolium medium]|uniref:Uncharacterized protein n=1 Tax=Trifolium medium TaxID=97028 RepID=A0A392NDI5_9FABA|nr:hypothetical protein [Trifolium medium]
MYTITHYKEQNGYRSHMLSVVNSMELSDFDALSWVRFSEHPHSDACLELFYYEFAVEVFALEGDGTGA